MDSSVYRGLRIATATLLTLAFLSGLALLGFGVVALFDSIRGLITENHIPAAFIVLGAIIAVVTGLGLLAVSASNRPVLLSFVVLFGILILAQVVLTVTAFSARRSVADLVDRSWTKAWKQSPRVIRDIQETFQCCGLKDTTDRAYPKSAPDACVRSPDFGYKDSCYDSVLHAVEKYQGGIIAAAVSVAVLQGLTFILAAILYSNMPTAEHREQGLLAEHESWLDGGSLLPKR
ncbi:Tetraspanin/Peripherin [Hyaloraphidium curvatum]|nr:Tetraspanin/Peripherin [Hyaloraphidium curvatum]